MASSNLTSGFIDLATYDELEKYMYGGADATAYFVRETRKATWFTQVPVVLSRQSGTPAFGNTCQWNISRAGDYLLNTWLRVTVPQLTTSAVLNANTGVAWTPNLMHNLVREVSISFNDLVAQSVTSQHLDFWAAFTVPASKRVGYDNMIGNVGFLTNPTLNNTQPVGAPALPSSFGGGAVPLIGPAGGTVLNLPLPLFYTRDSGVALPTAALPYNDMKIRISFRNLGQLVAGMSSAPPAGPPAVPNVAPLNLFQAGANVQTVNNVDLTNVELWATYAIVSNQERKRMACAPRDILIEQVQVFNHQPFNATAANFANQYDIRFSQAIKLLFFGVLNQTSSNGNGEVGMCNRSNYTSRQPVVGAGGVGSTFTRVNGQDPVAQTTLFYENTVRLASMGSDYFSLVCPWYTAPTIPNITGFHLYSYSLDFMCLDPLGSTNYGKLTNISLRCTTSQDAAAAAVPTAAVVQNAANTFLFVASAINNNIIRISGGALGFPVL